MRDFECDRCGEIMNSVNAINQLRSPNYDYNLCNHCEKVESESVKIKPIKYDLLRNSFDNKDVDVFSEEINELQRNFMDCYYNWLKENKTEYLKQYIDTTPKEKIDLDELYNTNNLATKVECSKIEDKVVIIDKNMYDAIHKNVPYWHTGEITEIAGYKLIVEQGDSEEHAIVMPYGQYEIIKDELDAIGINFWEVF